MNKKLKRTIIMFVMIGVIMVLFKSTEKVYAADIVGIAELNNNLIVNVPADGDYLYSFDVTETGVLAISGDFKSHSGGWVKILDKNGKVLMTDEGKWAINNITGKDNLSLVYQCVPGSYYIELLNNSSDDTYDVNIMLKYSKINDITNKTKLFGKLNRDEMGIYKVSLSNTSYLNFKGDFYESTSLTIYILDENGVELDYDKSADGDWTTDNTTGLNKMNYNTNILKAGTYYIKVNNQMSGALSYDLKFSIKVPATKIKINRSSLTLSKGESYTLKATLSPSKTTDIVKWISSNKKIITVSSKGKVTAKNKGTAYVTAVTSSGKQKRIKVIVK